jgi:hypothetical protein
MAFLFKAFGANIDLENNGNASIKIPGLPGITLLSGNGPSVNKSFSINNFTQNLNRHNETARTDKFDVSMIPPASVASYIGMSPADMMKGLSLQCEVSELPSRDIQMTEYMTHAFIRRVPHQNQYGTANFTFICTGDLWEKRMFDAWLDLMVPVQTGLVNYPVDANGQRMYETDIICNQYDSMGTLIYAATLIDAVPTNMGPLNQSWDNDSIHRLSMTFMFRKWTTIDTSFATSTTFAGSNPGILPSAVSGIVSTVAQAATQVQDARAIISGGVPINSALNAIKNNI